MFRLVPFALAAALLVPAVAPAQVADPAALAAQRAAMDRLAWMRGTWRGPAVTRGPGGEHRVTQTERIGSFLDGTLTLIEGKGYNPDGSTGFHAFGVVSFDPASGKYTLSSSAQGRRGEFVLTPTKDGYVWEIPAGPAVIRYTATRDGKTWHEVGDRIVAGGAPQRFFEMTLTRIGDTDWPEAGSVGPD